MKFDCIDVLRGQKAISKGRSSALKWVGKSTKLLKSLEKHWKALKRCFKSLKECFASCFEHALMALHVVSHVYGHQARIRLLLCIELKWSKKRNLIHLNYIYIFILITHRTYDSCDIFKVVAKRPSSAPFSRAPPCRQLHAPLWRNLPAKPQVGITCSYLSTFQLNQIKILKEVKRI